MAKDLTEFGKMWQNLGISLQKIMILNQYIHEHHIKSPLSFKVAFYILLTALSHHHLQHHSVHHHSQVHHPLFRESQLQQQLQQQQQQVQQHHQQQQQQQQHRSNSNIQNNNNNNINPLANNPGCLTPTGYLIVKCEM